MFHLSEESYPDVYEDIARLEAIARRLEAIPISNMLQRNGLTTMSQLTPKRDSERRHTCLHSPQVNHPQSPFLSIYGSSPDPRSCLGPCILPGRSCSSATEAFGPDSPQSPRGTWASGSFRLRTRLRNRPPAKKKVPSSRTRCQCGSVMVCGSWVDVEEKRPISM